MQEGDESNFTKVSNSFWKKLADYFGLSKRDVEIGWRKFSDKQGRMWFFETFHFFQEDGNMERLKGIERTKFAPLNYWVGSGFMKKEDLFAGRKSVITVGGETIEF